jgi:atypical dual specificity phosphatase
MPDESPQLRSNGDGAPCFVVDGVLAGIAHPGWGTELRGRLAELRRAGITAVVSLSASAPDPEEVRSAGLRHLHAPVGDFSAPSGGDLERIVAFIDEVASSGGATAVHCTSGRGRTGTVLAAYLVARQGLSPDEAIRRVRELRPGSVETDSQEEAVFDFARRRPARPGGA